MSIASLASPTADPQQLASMLTRLSPQQLQAYAQAHQNDMLVVSMVMAEQSRRQKQNTAMQGAQPQQPSVRDQVISQGLPEESGIAQLPAPNMQNMAGGGIVAFAGGKEVKGDRKAAFMEEYGTAAQYAGERLGVDPQILLAQWGLESDYGRKTVGKFNLGNIKDVTGKGPRALDKAEGSRDAYKSYDSPEDFAADYAGLISRRFPEAMGAGSDVARFSAGLKTGQQGGYATDPNYAAKLAATSAGLGGTPQAQAEPKAYSYSENVGTIPGATPDPRQSFMGPAAPPPRDRDFGGLGRALGAAEGFGSLASVVPAIPIGLLKTALREDDKSFEQNFGESIWTPRTDTGQGVVRGVGEVMEALKIPAMPFMTGAAASTRGVTAAQRAAKEAEAAAALAGKKVATPRLASIPEDTSVMGRMRSGLGDIARRDVDQANAARLGVEAKIAPLKVQNEMLKVGDQTANTLYGQGVANRAARAGLTGLGATAAANAAPEDMPSGLAAAAQAEQPAAAINPADLSKDDKKDLVDTAKATVPAADRKKTGFDNDDWMMLGLQLLAGNKAGVTPFEALGKAGIATLGSKKEREKAEREQESQKFIDELRQSQAGLAGAQAEYYGEGKKMNDANTAVEKAFKNWIDAQKLNPLTKLELTPERERAEYNRILRDTYERFNIPLPAGVLPAGPQSGASLKYDAATGTIK
jgi:flagellum-specific peptidoglycan hydrolase FlgJ